MADEQKELLFKFSQVLLGLDKDDEEYLIGEPYPGEYDWFGEDDTEEPYSEAEEEEDDLDEDTDSYSNRVNGKDNPDLPRQLPLWPE